MQDDHAIADLLSTLARQYRKQIADQTLPKTRRGWKSSADWT
jgi:hypothetical protein